MRTLVIAVVLCLFSVVTANGPVRTAEDKIAYHRFARYISDFEKVYKNEEEKLQRFLFFKENMEKAAVYNELHNGTATFGPTIFSDLSADEFASKYLSKFPEIPEIHVNETIRTTTATPASVDWVALGKVTPIRNQGDCGSCWSFTALAEVESQLLIKKGREISIVDSTIGRL